MEAQHAALKRILRDIGPCLVAFSGGVDSTLLLKVAHDVLGDGATAITAVSPSLASSEREEAGFLARLIGTRHLLVETQEIDDPRYARNDAARCYYCKTELFRHLRSLADGLGFRHVAYGLIVDDLAEFRPGHRAAAEAGVRSPLAEAGLTKLDVRELSRELGLPTWDLPASPCLSSRVPHGTAVTSEVLRRVERAEEAVRRLGFREFRVRHLGEAARVEVAPAEMERLAEGALRMALEAGVRGAGYQTVLIDPEGYRRGRLNEALGPEVVSGVSSAHGAR